ncbi:MAG: hypothetical protein MJ170_00705 [Alphaproteobacteria bacterium]|nr:hypothetical protein [Alphaproteobacteria bacterium]
MMELNETTAQQRLADLGMDDMPVIECHPVPTQVSPDWFIKYKELVHRFMETLMDSSQEIAFLNLSPDEFMDLISGRAIPRNMSVRFRVPLMWGGALDIDNLFMCRTFPYSYNLDRFIIEQSGNKTIWLPNPVKKIYVPAHTAGGGDGGNATSDRLSQMAAQIAATRGME